MTVHTGSHKRRKEGAKPSLLKKAGAAKVSPLGNVPGEPGSPGPEGAQITEPLSPILAATEIGPEELADELPERRYRKDERNFTGIFRQYILFSHQVESITLSESFNMFIIIVIVVAGVLVGVQTYGCTEETYQKAKYDCYPSLDENPYIIWIDNVILAIFTVEVILKTLAEGLEPWRYFTGPEWAWNVFDFTIVILCMPIPFPFMSGGNNSQVALLRLMRLMRVMKLVKKIPQLQMIMMGLISGMKSIGYIGLLLFMVFYMYAILGFFMFEKNDPWHFGTLMVSMNTLFRMMTLEDWTDVMYVNLYGCDGYSIEQGLRFDSGFYVLDEPWFDQANNLTLFTCEPGQQAHWLITILYMFSFIIISALVALSLILGAITMGMADSMEEMKELESARDRTEKMAQAEKKAAELKAARAGGDAFSAAAEKRPSKVKGPISASNKVYPIMPQDPLDGPPSAAQDVCHDGDVIVGKARSKWMSPIAWIRSLKARDSEDERAEDLMRVVLLAAWNGERISFKELEAGFLESTPTTGIYKTASDRMVQIRDWNVFQHFVTFVILTAGVVVGIEAETEVEQNLANTLILIVFIVEIIVKVIAEYDRPLRFFYKNNKLDKWNTFDFVVVVGSLIPMGSASSIVTMLRLLRLLRVLKLVKALPQLQVIVEALINGLSSIYYIGIIMFMFFYVFGILGMILFQANDPWHFGTLHDTIITLFRMATLEDWTDVMYINMMGCKYYGYGDMPELCDDIRPPGYNETDPDYQDHPTMLAKYIALMYCWVIVIFGGLILVPLFIGVVVSSMEEAVQAQKTEQEMQRQLNEIRDAGEIPSETISLYVKVFEMLDVDDGGTVDIDELILGLSMVGVEAEPEDVEPLMAEVLDGQLGELNKANFVLFMNLAKQRKGPGESDKDPVTPPIDTKESEGDRGASPAPAAPPPSLVDTKEPEMGDRDSPVMMAVDTKDSNRAQEADFDGQKEPDDVDRQKRLL